jgi:starch synthase
MLEAFASSTPVIATDWGGASDYVTAETGILVAPTNRREFVDGLTGAMRSLAQDPARARQMGAAGRRLVELQYSWKAKAETMLGIYARVTEETSKQRRPG